MSCKGKGGYIAIIIGVLVALYVANKSHAETKNFQGVEHSTEMNISSQSLDSLNN